MPQKASHLQGVFRPLLNDHNEIASSYEDSLMRILHQSILYQRKPGRQNQKHAPVLGRGDLSLEPLQDTMGLGSPPHPKEPLDSLCQEDLKITAGEVTHMVHLHAH